MALEKLENGRAKIHDLGNTLEIIIPSKKNILIILFVSLWLMGWFVGETMVLGTLLFGKTPMGFETIFFIVWLSLWTIGGLSAIVILLWNVVGQEVITLSRDRLEIARKVFGIGPSKEYIVSEVKNLRIFIDRNTFTRRSVMSFWGFSGGLIKFDYGMKTVRFAQSIDEAEAVIILEKLKERESLKEVCCSAEGV